MNGQKLKERANNLKNEIIGKTSRFFEGKKGTELYREVIKFAVKGTAAAIYSFLLASSESLFGTFPLGTGLLCGASDNIFFIYIGCAAAALSGGSSLSLMQLVVYTLILLMRFAMGKWLQEGVENVFREPVGIRSIISLIAGFSQGIYFCIIDGFSLYSLGGLVFMSGVSFGLAAILSGADAKAHPFHRQAAYCAIGFCLVNSLSHYSVFGFSLAVASCTCICLYSAITRDMFRATIFSLICGFACNRPALAPMFAIMALICSLAKKLKLKSAIPAGMFGAIAYGFWVYGMKAVTYVIPDVICGVVILLPILYFTKNSGKIEEKGEKDKEDLTDIEKNLIKQSEKDAKSMSVALESLAKNLENMSQSLKKPDTDSLRKMTGEVFSDVCLGCKLSAVCSMSGCGSRDNNSSVKNIFQIQASNALFDRGYVTSDDLPSRFSEVCKNTGDIVYKINESYGRLLRKLVTDDRTTAFAAGYRAVSKLIDEGEKRRGEEHEVDAGLSRLAMGLCRELDLSPRSAYVYGKRKKNVVIKGKGDLAVSASKLKGAFSNLCSVELTNPFIETVEDNWKVTMESKAVFKAEMAYSTKNCCGEEVCGDHVCLFESDDGYYYAVLSDGMGSGRQASLVSTVCCEFAEKLSVCGGSLKTVLETINSYVLSRSNECSATLDILKIDGYSGMASFVKSGAVSSMVIRGGHVYRISSASVPIGVMRELNSEQISLPLKEGDFIIMTSDGVTPDFESGLFAADIVSKYSDRPPEEIADRIIACAAGTNRRPDDMSCIVVKIAANV